MKKFTFPVDVVVHDNTVDMGEIADAIAQCVSVDGLECVVKAPKEVMLSEQGYKVWRARVAGIPMSAVEEETAGVA